MLRRKFVRATEVRYIIILEAKVVRVLVSKFGVLQILLYGTFIISIFLKLISDTKRRISYRESYSYFIIIRQNSNKLLKILFTIRL
jgi:hypothetical protein